MMRVGDGDGEGVGGVGAGDRHPGQQTGDHGVDLGFLGAASADNGFLDKAGGIFAHLEAGAGRRHQDDAAGLAELQRRLRVLVDEYFLDRGAVGLSVGNQRLELGSQV